MKKFIVTALLAAMPFIATAQTTAFDKFENVEGIDFLNVEKDMFKMLSSIKSSISDEKTEKYAGLIEDIDKLRVFTTKEKKHRKALTNAVANYVKQDKLEELMSFNGKDAKVKIFVNKGGEATLIKEGLVFVEDMDDKGVVVVSFTGNLNLNDLSKLSEKN